jgi:hypothetical protein
VKVTAVTLPPNPKGEKLAAGELVNTRRVAVMGGTVGLIVPLMLMLLIYFVGINARLRIVLWPFSVMLTPDWFCTVRGLLITTAATAFNCIAYMTIALLLNTCLRLGSQRGRQ